MFRPNPTSQLHVCVCAFCYAAKLCTTAPADTLAPFSSGFPDATCANTTVGVKVCTAACNANATGAGYTATCMDTNQWNITGSCACEWNEGPGGRSSSSWFSGSSSSSRAMLMLRQQQVHVVAAATTFVPTTRIGVAAILLWQLLHRRLLCACSLSVSVTPT
jgi:hypothetical protein